MVSNGYNEDEGLMEAHRINTDKVLPLSERVEYPLFRYKDITRAGRNFLTESLKLGLLQPIANRYMSIDPTYSRLHGNVIKRACRNTEISPGLTTRGKSEAVILGGLNPATEGLQVKRISQESVEV
ncbi:MAG: hypothetical protein ACTSRU_01395 [Candidatus Hodarchaeales archaeon]